LPAAKDLARYGLDKPRTVTLLGEGDKVLARVRIGAEKDGKRYAVSDGFGKLVRVEKSTVDDWPWTAADALDTPAHVKAARAGNDWFLYVRCAAVAAGRAGPLLAASVSGPGLRWARGRHAVQVTAGPAPDTVLASAGLLRWELELPPGSARTIELRVEPVGAGAGSRPMAAERPPRLWPEARLEADDPRAGALLDAALADLQALLLRDPVHRADLHLAAGAPWRLGLAPADALWAARMLLPFGTRLAAGTLRSVARLQDAGSGRVPGVPRDAGARLPPLHSGVEATLLFVTVLEEARRWGLPEREVAELLPAAERSLAWLRAAARAPGGDGFVADGPAGGPLRAEVQAHAHRAALHGAELVQACGRPGAGEWREYAAGLRARFRSAFWIEDPGGGRPALAVTPGGGPLPLVSSSLTHLLDTGLLGSGVLAPGLLDKGQAEQLGRLFATPDLDSGWGLRTLSAKAPGFSPFGHRGGAVRVHETAVAVAGLAALGLEKEAAALVTGVLDAAGAFGMRLPEIYGGEQRTAGGAPCPHPVACRPSAVAAAGAVHILVALAGVRPDAPGGAVAVRPMADAPLGALRLSGLRVAGEPFAVRVSRLGLGMVEEAAEGLQLGA